MTPFDRIQYPSQHHEDERAILYEFDLLLRVAQQAWIEINPLQEELANCSEDSPPSSELLMGLAVKSFSMLGIMWKIAYAAERDPSYGKLKDGCRLLIESRNQRFLHPEHGSGNLDFSYSAEGLLIFNREGAESIALKEVVEEFVASFDALTHETK